jgi:parallel beta-helix repeat protein
MSRPCQGSRRCSVVLPLLCLAPIFAACSDSASRGLAPTEPSLSRTAEPALHVSTTGTDVGDCTATPCRTINYAIAQASVGDVISADAGTYNESVTITKRLSLVGNDATIDATGQASPPNAIVISGPDAAGATVTGFTVQHAGLEGIFVVQTSRITIENNLVRENDTYGPFNPLCADQPDDCGEAIHLQSVTNAIIRNNVVRDNVGGILLTDENGPTSGNMISDNTVLNNSLDCGITLASHWFSLQAPAAPDVAGVYRNTVQHNTSNGNGAAGIGVFAGPPGAAAWGNTVTGNTANNNGFAGIMIHSHTPLQFVDNNVITNNTLSGNGIDDDNPIDDAPTGISIFSAVIPIPSTVVAANHVTGEHYGIVSYNAVKLSGLPSNKLDVPVPTRIQ